MPVSLKDLYDLGQKILSAHSKNQKSEQERQFEEGKQLFLMEMITRARTYHGNAYRPTPGTIQFAYCEALFKDGLLRRDLIAGIYFVTS
jgi:hypothetical protein